MLLSTQGLVLHTVPYAESSVIAKVFTRQLGLRSYIIKGVRGNRGRVKQNLLQPLSSLDMVVYDSHRSGLNYVKELSPHRPCGLPDPVEAALRFFMTEVLYKALREEEPMPELFDYAEQAVEAAAREGTGDAPVLFLLRVAHYLGIEPMDNHAAAYPYFDLEEGRFVAAQADSTLAASDSQVLHDYLAAVHGEAQPPKAPLQQRTALVNMLLTYYHLHLSGFADFRSHEILHTVLR